MRSDRAAIPMVVIAAKMLESPGPVIHSQRRVGKSGKIFNVYKFRSMYTDAGEPWVRGGLLGMTRASPLFGKSMENASMRFLSFGTS